MEKRNLFNRIVLLLIGLVLRALGIAFSIKADLGATPSASLPYTLNQAFGFSVGEMTIAILVFTVFLQIIILGKEYKKIQLLQLPLAFIFGYFTDAAMLLTDNLKYTNYLGQMLICLIGIMLSAIAIRLEFDANILVLANEGLVMAICEKIKVRKGTVKIIYDLLQVILAVVVGLYFLNEIVGIREGTLLAALLVGTFEKMIKDIINKFKAKTE